MSQKNFNQRDTGNINDNCHPDNNNGSYSTANSCAKIDQILYNPGVERLTVVPNAQPMEYSSDLLGSPRIRELCDVATKAITHVAEMGLWKKGIEESRILQITGDAIEFVMQHPAPIAQ